jgi:hypothetical protein
MTLLVASAHRSYAPFDRYIHWGFGTFWQAGLGDSGGAIDVHPLPTFLVVHEVTPSYRPIGLGRRPATPSALAHRPSWVWFSHLVHHFIRSICDGMEIAPSTCIPALAVVWRLQLGRASACLRLVHACHAARPGGHGLSFLAQPAFCGSARIARLFRV